MLFNQIKHALSSSFSHFYSLFYENPYCFGSRHLVKFHLKLIMQAWWPSSFKNIFLSRCTRLHCHWQREHERWFSQIKFVGFFDTYQENECILANVTMDTEREHIQNPQILFFKFTPFILLYRLANTFVHFGQETLNIVNRNCCVSTNVAKIFHTKKEK